MATEPKTNGRVVRRVNNDAQMIVNNLAKLLAVSIQATANEELAASLAAQGQMVGELNMLKNLLNEVDVICQLAAKHS
jgi:hypothetical protein